MAVSNSFRDFVLEQLEYARRDIRAKRMFGGVGFYAGDLFFAIADNDTLYFKVDDETRPRFVESGMGPFRPYGAEGETMQYYQVPIGVLEDSDALKTWVADAAAVAQRARSRKRRRVAR